MPADRSPAPLAGPVVVDASVVVEYLVDLSLTESATSLFHRAADAVIELWAPDLLYAESASALRKLERLRAIPAPAAAAAVDRLERLPITSASVAPLLPAVWSRRTHLTAYDASSVALAEALDATFVTADRDLADELRKRRVPLLFVGDL